MKQFKKSLLIIGLCFLMIGCTNDAMSKVTKKLQDAGYDISYLTDDFTAVNITKTEKDKDRIQFCAYLEKKVVTILSYLPIIVISIKRLLVLSMSTKMMIILLVKVPKRKLKKY